jgi:cytidylate kinase
LKEQGLDVSLSDLLQEIIERDARDRGRAISPLVPAEDAVIVDTTDMPIQAVYDFIMGIAHERGIIPNTRA